MRKTIAMAAAMAALAGCNQLTGGDAAEDEATETEEAGAEAESEAEDEPEMLANGAPAYPGMDISAAEVRPPSGQSQTVNFQSGASMFEIHDFYREYYENNDYDISTLNISASPSGSEAGGNISISLNGQTGGSRVSISPRDEGGEFDLDKEYGEQLPAYTGVSAEDVDVREHDSGRRTLRFETSDAPIEVFNYYRSAFDSSGLAVNSVSLYAQSREYRRSANVTASSRYNATGSRVYTSVRDPSRQTQAPAAGDK